jgi:hypothetical protein
LPIVLAFAALLVCAELVPSVLHESAFEWDQVGLVLALAILIFEFFAMVESRADDAALRGSKPWRTNATSHGSNSRRWSRTSIDCRTGLSPRPAAPGRMAAWTT